MLDAVRQRRPRAARDRRHRQRLKSGVRVAPVEYDGTVLNFLIATHWLAELDADDTRKVGVAIAAMLADTARG
jgi:hypothetical protein